MSIGNVNNQNAITAPSAIGSYSDMRRAVVQQTLEKHYRAAAAENRRNLRIPQGREIKPTARNASSEYTRIRAHVTSLYNSALPGFWRFIECPQARQAAIENEISMTAFGHIERWHGLDPVVANTGLSKIPFADSVENWNHARDMMQDQLRGLFAHNGINVPLGVRLNFMVDPYDFRARVTGTDDADLIARIEALLNHGDNAGQLFDYIFNSGSLDSVQMSQEQRQKFMLTRRVLFLTGVDMRNMTITNSMFVTPEGRHLDLVLGELLSGREDLSKGEAGFIIRELNNLAKVWNDIPSLNLSIGWRNGELISMHDFRLNVNG